MLGLTVTTIVPDGETCYLVGPEGLVWEQPAIGAPVILAARTAAERGAWAAHVAQLLAMGLVPYGVPLNQQAVVAMFGGSALRDCEWVPWRDAPAPAGAPADELPTVAAVCTGEVEA